jgi:hypothetical protein
MACRTGGAMQRIAFDDDGASNEGRWIGLLKLILGRWIFNDRPVASTTRRMRLAFFY